jgi:plastocyanin
MSIVNRAASVIVAAAFILSGCGGESGSEATSTAPSASAPAASTTPMGSASISGSVTFTGTAPARARIRQDRECSALNEEAVTSETVVVNDNGTLKNVFIYVKDGLGEYNFAVPTEPVVMDQAGCMYKPHVFGIQVGQTMKILNSDPLLHNLHTLPEKNRSANFAMPKQGDERDQSFRVAEVMMKIKCDVHPWMSSYAGIVDHPFYSVSDESGVFDLSQLPAGTYEIEAWHEEYGVATQTVTVTDGEQVALDFDFGA